MSRQRILSNESIIALVNTFSRVQVIAEQGSSDAEVRPGHCGGESANSGRRLVRFLSDRSLLVSHHPLEERGRNWRTVQINVCKCGFQLQAFEYKSNLSSVCYAWLELTAMWKNPLN